MLELGCGSTLYQDWLQESKPHLQGCLHPWRVLRPGWVGEEVLSISGCAAALAVT